MPQKETLPRLKFSFPRFSFTAKLLYSKNPKTIQKIAENLPFEGYAERWGEEIYFSTNWDMPSESETKKVGIGDIAFWSPGSAIAIFFGPTPLSKGPKPVPASAVSVFATVENLKGVLSHLKEVRHDEKIRVSRA
ncbi:MAG: cyclophilin-like family protein [archaeon]